MADRIINGQFLYAVTSKGVIEIRTRTVTEDYFVGTDLETSQALLFTYDDLDEAVFRDKDAALSTYKEVKHDD